MRARRRPTSPGPRVPAAHRQLQLHSPALSAPIQGRNLKCCRARGIIYACVAAAGCQAGEREIGSHWESEISIFVMLEASFSSRSKTIQGAETLPVQEESPLGPKHWRHHCPHGTTRIYKNHDVSCPTAEYLEKYPMYGSVLPP
ncbi:stabilizer of axonemal microtubules 2 [Hippopotamus amphibius kiboko]|uniref:stabilizer of axonemal microtubules 2 n=1 Tax=Hippopotamus amphibius kiboko TaxID=575201 RepID=UPI002594A8BE|nr:stabilizer of axonemal microtubules 2 [Hippopotamus amphibius kiboko]XP_057577343.1 stabilizer of axonemal microtubules 2 [Hippopotamus amphibius kiboko]